MILKRGSTRLRGLFGRRNQRGLSIISLFPSSSSSCFLSALFPFNNPQTTPTMERRRAELEEKRRKLEEMKRAREERMSATAALRRTVVPTSTTSTADAIQTPYRGNRQQVDDLLNNILGQPTPAVPSSGSTSRPGSSLSGTYPKTPGPLYRNQGVQDVPETPMAGTSRSLGAQTQARQVNGAFECVFVCHSC